LDVSYPTHADLLQVETSLDGFVKGFSPVFMHMTKDGKVKQGIEGVPTGSKRPVLLVANHQLYGLDIGLILREFLLKKHTLIRGLAHPAVFESGLSTDGIKNLFLKYGAVPVSPHNAHELLSRNETVLLFPGGANEAYHGKAEENKLIWNSKSDFVRMAAIFNATIIPVAAIGISPQSNVVHVFSTRTIGSVGLSSSFRMLLDANELKALPLIGRNLKRSLV
jgi:1-acyl-sn-glycerol-3-phosphate acyltransferase